MRVTPSERGPGARTAPAPELARRTFVLRVAEDGSSATIEDIRTGGRARIEDLNGLGSHVAALLDEPHRRGVR